MKFVKQGRHYELIEESVDDGDAQNRNGLTAAESYTVHPVGPTKVDPLHDVSTTRDKTCISFWLFGSRA